jgi:hypothetical protein
VHLGKGRLVAAMITAVGVTLARRLAPGGETAGRSQDARS